MSSTKPTSTSDWEPPSPEHLQRMLPQYEITGVLGRGGMGAVYEGRQAKLNRKVAIKVLPETFTRGEDELNFAKRFEQEAQAMAGLDHPAIISVYDFGETGEGQLYFVMEFVDGMDIHQYLHTHGGKLPQEQALAIVAHVLDALEYAHSHGIAHRDIKPANILLNREGRVKIADFGLAKKFGEAASDSVPALTMTNVAVGTPDFVAPEALDPDAKPDHRADLYAVGVMLYQMLTGRIPRGQFKAPSEFDAGLDPRLDAIVSRALQTDPDDRYPSAAAVRADLDTIFSQPFAKVEAGEESAQVAKVVPVTTRVRAGEPAKKSPTLVYGSVGLAAAVVAGVVIFAMRGGPESGISEAAPDPVAASIPEAPTPAVVPAPAVKKPEPPTSPTVVSAPPPAPEVPAGAVAPAAEPKGAAPEPEPTAPAVAQTSNPAPVSDPAPAAPPAPEPAPASPPAPTVEDPVVSPLATLPGLQTRLEGFHNARRTQLGELAGKYLGGLESRLNQAANAGDLRLATAFEEEKTRVQTLQKSLANKPADPMAAVADPALTSLPELPGGSPDSLVGLRQAWTTESAKIRETLDLALRQSLQALEVELTRARDFENAKAVLAWREELEKPAARLVELVAGTNEAGAVAQSPTAPGSMTTATNSGSDAELAAATKEKPFENSLGMKFVPVPGTDVLFCIHEVRYGDYREYAKAAKEVVDETWKEQSFDGYELNRRGDEHPVTNVSWVDSQKFCAWLSQKEGRAYRLPTDREWSHAVGIGASEVRNAATTPANIARSQNDFPWGKTMPPPRGAGNYSDESRREKAPKQKATYLEGYDDGFPTTAPVMSFNPNPLGIFDLGGNVFEWCDDWYSKDKTARVLRGGSWTHANLESLLSSARYQNSQDHRFLAYGFRIVVDKGSPSAPSPAAPVAATPESASVTATKEKPFENSLGMMFVPVPGTEVLFCIHETRWRDYAEYAESAENIDPKWESQEFDETITKRNGKDVPVVNVNWEDAHSFCTWLSEKEKKIYRLPSDKEWSVAVGIGHIEKWEAGTEPRNVFRSAEMFPWGPSWPPPAGFGNYRDESRKSMIPNSPAGTVYIDGFDDGYPGLAPVMSFPPNSHGLFDLSGNVAEWVDDWFDSTRKGKVLRGGSWSDGDPKNLLSSYRNFQTADYRSIQRGFRIVLETGTPAPASVTPATAPAPADATKNPFGWQPIPENPFPLPHPVRPTTPCRVVAWRLDGKPVDEAAFREEFGGVPAQLGDVVDLSARSGFTSRFMYPIAMDAQGSISALSQRTNDLIPPELQPAVAIDGGRDIALALHEDGRVSPLLLSQSAINDRSDLVANVTEWTNAVFIVAGTETYASLQPDGVPLVCGKNDKGSLDLPTPFQKSIIRMDLGTSVTWLVKHSSEGVEVNRIGTNPLLRPALPSSARFFISSLYYTCDERGNLKDSNSKTSPASAEAFRGAARNVNDIVSLSESNRGIAALREGEDQWRFWGDRKELGGYDPKYCETKAAGCWKLFLIGDYVLALKPVASLKPDDWMGTAAP